jgi:hypothetical protein
MSSRCVSLLPRTSLLSDSEQYVWRSPLALFVPLADPLCPLFLIPFTYLEPSLL